MSKWLDFVSEWEDCTRCHLHKCRENLVLARGKIPCDLCFVGEAPGKSEDSLGQPFVGPAGILLDKMVERALGEIRVCPVCRSAGVYTMDCETHHTEPPTRLRTAFCNLVCCIPLGEDGRKTKEPDHDAIQACRPRLEKFLLELARPRIVVAVGKLPFTSMERGLKDSVKISKTSLLIQVTHPAAILRAPLAHQSLMRQRVVVNIRRAVEQELGLGK